MQLRGAVKAPERLENETTIEERQQEVTRRTKGRIPRQYVDYNPDLPPAAFPTLEKPLSQEPSNQIISQNEATPPDDEDERTSVTPVHIHNRKTHNACNKIKVAEKELAGISSDTLENSIASNCDLNPIYEKNMMEMANAGKTMEIYKEMEDSDSEHHSDQEIDPETPSCAIPIPNPKWGDLSPRIQVEIFDNLCKDHSFSVTSQILGLTGAEREKAQVYLDQREKQIDLEDLQLQRMRDRQLTSLLNIDNSDPKNRQISYKQRFYQTSRKYSHKLEKAVKIDFFSCYAGELVNAQRFLDQRGLDMVYAGEWCNGTSTWRKTESENQTVAQSAPIDASVPGIPRDPFDISMPKQERRMPRYPGRPKDLFMRQGDFKLLSEHLLISCEESMEEEDTHREFLSGADSHTKKAPKRRVNRVCESEHPFIQPLKLVKTLPPMIRWHYSKPPSKCNISENPASQTGRDGLKSTMSSFASLKQKLEKAKVELQRQSKTRMEAEADSDDDRSSPCSLLVGQTIFSDDSCSSLVSPSRVIREKSPETIHTDSLFPLEDTDHGLATSISDNDAGVTIDGPMATPSSVSRSPSPSPSSLGFHDQSMVTFMESSPDAKLTGIAEASDMDDDCDDDEVDIDEMVMVPTGLKKVTD